MCGRAKRAWARPEGGYEGQTVRLGEAAPRSCGAAGFPWWTLWLIWPAIWLGKGAIAASAALLTGAGPTLLALALIGVGLLLLLRDRRRG